MALAEASAEQLMLLSDVASATGQRQRSISALRRVVADFPSDPVAPLAAWSLGKQLEKAGDKAGALRAFADYRALSPEGDFAEDALVREMKDAAERGDEARLKELAAQYERDFPEGRRSADVEHLLSRGAEGSAFDAGVEGSPHSSDKANDKTEEPSKPGNPQGAGKTEQGNDKAPSQKP
jgi:hypothetical protein